MKIPTVGIAAYPKELERWWWRKAIEKWPVAGKPKVLHLLREEVVSQSDRFNKERRFSPQSYGTREISVITYGNFYFPRTWAQLAFVLSEIHYFRNWQPPRKGPLRILDLGCGSGSAGLSALHLLREWKIKNPIELKAVDYSNKSLSYLRMLHKGMPHLWPHTKLKTEGADLKVTSANQSQRKFDLILLNSALNEIVGESDKETTSKKIIDFAAQLKPSGFLLILEPALSTISNRLHEAAILISSTDRLNLHAPYFNGLPCPFAGKNSRYRSHEVRKGIVTRTTQLINAPLHLNLRDLKFSFIALSPKKPVELERTPCIFRIVSPISKRKGLYFFIGIDTNGKEYTYEIQVRDLNPRENKLVESFQRGDILRLQDYITLDEGHRLRIPKAASIEVLFAPR